MIDGIRTAGARLAARAAYLLQHHPRQVTTALAVLLLCGAGGALAVAVDNEIDPALLPVREVVEAVQPLPLQAQWEALDAFRFNLFRTEAARSSDTVESLLGRLGISDPAAAAFLRADATFRRQVLRAGRNVTVEASDNQQLARLTARWLGPGDRYFQRFVAERTSEGGFHSRVEQAQLVPALRLASGEVETTLFDATDEAGVPDAVALQLVSIFEGEIDFNRGLRPGDRFTVQYEALMADGEPLRTGRVTTVEFTNRGKKLQAMWFQDPGTDGGYFDLEGRSLARRFLASPVEVTRITSNFAMRMHPVLNHMMKHEGVDYGGPVGTTVRTIGEGVVKQAGWAGAFGNLVVVDHGRGETTYYAHLSRVEVRKGQRVQRGQSIGRLGGTGRVTGPHLHFEFRENGVNKDPILALRRSQPLQLTVQARAKFDRDSRSIRKDLEIASAVATVAPR